MTVLTFPSTGSKSDKVPLVDDVDRRDQASPQPIPAPSYNPKDIESGEAGLLKDASVPVVGTSEEFPPKKQIKSATYRLTRNIIILFVLAGVIMYSSNVLCKKLKSDRRHLEKIPEQPDSDNKDRLYKSYTSYADAESEMLSMPPSSPTDNDYDQRIGSDPMEDVYRKLSNIAINKGLLDQKKNTVGIISLYSTNVEIDHKDDKIFPPLAITNSARFIHDFSVNITGIVDVEKHRCFVMPLMRKALVPPVSLYDLLFKMTSGYYSTDLKKFMGNMHVVEPAITDLSDFGLYISKDCADYSTFKLEKVEPTPDV